MSHYHEESSHFSSGHSHPSHGYDDHSRSLKNSSSQRHGAGLLTQGEDHSRSLKKNSSQRGGGRLLTQGEDNGGSSHRGSRSTHKKDRDDSSHGNGGRMIEETNYDSDSTITPVSNRLSRLTVGTRGSLAGESSDRRHGGARDSRISESRHTSSRKSDSRHTSSRHPSSRHTNGTNHADRDVQSRSSRHTATSGKLVSNGDRSSHAPSVSLHSSSRHPSSRDTRSRAGTHYKDDYSSSSRHPTSRDTRSRTGITHGELVPYDNRDSKYESRSSRRNTSAHH